MAIIRLMFPDGQPTFTFLPGTQSVTLRQPTTETPDNGVSSWFPKNDFQESRIPYHSIL